MSLSGKIESLLFVATKPVSVKYLASHTGATPEAVKEAVTALHDSYQAREAGVVIVSHDDEVQIMTAPEHTDMIQAVLKEEASGELTRPAVETLTIIAYRGPVTKAEIEQIRGVNCTMILRNLQIRGLVEVQQDQPTALPRYLVTMEFLRFLGVSSVRDLPEYESLRADRALADILAAAQSVATATVEET